jgi:hypothetical protein
MNRTEQNVLFKVARSGFAEHLFHKIGEWSIAVHGRQS